MPRSVRSAFIVLLATFSGSTVVSAVEVTLASPLITRVPLPTALPSGGAVISARITVPSDAPSDLGVGAFACDRHGAWYQALVAEPLKPGSQRIRLRLGPSGRDGGGLGGDTPVNPNALAGLEKGGLLLWAPGNSRAVVRVADLTVEPLPAEAAGTALTDLTWDPAPRTGQRWEVHARPDPLPANPFDDGEYALDLVVTRPDGSEQRLPGFWDQPATSRDGGDREIITPVGQPRFTVRWRPRTPGIHQLRLESRRGAQVTTVALPSQAVSGAVVDPYVRIDQKDPRFLSVDGAFFWPIGINMRSVTDGRAQDTLAYRSTPQRGTLAYDAYLARFAAGGANAAEIWMSSWNLALEWRKDWPGYPGLGRYHLGHAWQLDRILDQAWARGIRVDLVLNNHGQASTEVDPEWASNPYNAALGGPCASAWEWFSAPAVITLQQRYRRYVVARYADHPAILCWKLWTEMDLTDAGRDENRREALAPWFEAATAHLAQIDTYGHLRTAHWSGSYKTVAGFDEVAKLPGLDLLTIDAYHDSSSLLAPLLHQSTQRRGLHRYGKAVLTTEYGGQWSGAEPVQMEAEHAVGAWVAMASGHAGAPMLWWLEWVDQGDRFAPYAAIGRFLAGEDLRGPEQKSLPLKPDANASWGWALGWSRKGRMLGYVLDQAWQAKGGPGQLREQTRITVANPVEPGAMTIEWWDADQGVAITSQVIQHPGGALVVTAPSFRRHLAFKLVRL